MHFSYNEVAYFGIVHRGGQIVGAVEAVNVYSDAYFEVLSNCALQRHDSMVCADKESVNVDLHLKWFVEGVAVFRGRESGGSGWFLLLLD